MTIDELLVFGKSHTSSDFAKILLAELLNRNPLEILNYLDYKVDDDLSKKYKEEIIALENGKPLQYVLGNVNFYGIKYYINENVLIPRFETEELVENLINYINKYFKESIDIIDLGTGSGAIGITLKKKIPLSNVDLLDISKDALEVAKKNADNMNAEVNLIEGDMLESVDKKYDVIVSNPPYIKTGEEIEKIVEKNEPHLALYAGEDGLLFYKKILKKINKNLKDKFIVAFEIGSDEKENVINLINKYMKDVTIIPKKDMSEKDRMIFIISNNLINE